jgi:general secretion pathway protein E
MARRRVGILGAHRITPAAAGAKATFECPETLKHHFLAAGVYPRLGAGYSEGAHSCDKNTLHSRWKSSPVSVETSFESTRKHLASLDASAESYAAQFVDVLLEAAHRLGASDLHLRPTPDGLELSVRIDGVLQLWGMFPAGKVSDVVTRLKVLADLLTYRTDVPQEGRVRSPKFPAEIRVSSFPTLHGEKAVVRLFAAEARYPFLENLGLPANLHQHLGNILNETSGALMITGPAGSGKTTTAYACLRELVRRSGGGRSIATLEDPVEVSLSGVAQSQVNPRAGFDLAAGLRSLLRQDPEVILVGEMRDPVTAGVAFQAALTGQLVLTTFHAGSAAGAISRLLDMGLEPYILRSGIQAVLCQRLVRKLCNCAKASETPDARLGLPVSRAKIAQGCTECHSTGYRGRTLLVEMLTLDMHGVAAGILSRSDAAALEQTATGAGMQTRWDCACRAIEAGITSAAEVRRVLGFSGAFSGGPG